MAELGNGLLGEQALQQGAELASLGCERVARAQAFAEAAARGAAKDENGIDRAILSSAAESGWVICTGRHGHGQVRCVDASTGRYAATGVCEHCYKNDWSPEVLDRRTREIAVSQSLEKEAAAIARKLDDERAAERQARLLVDQGNQHQEVQALPHDPEPQSANNRLDQSAPATVQGNPEHEASHRFNGSAVEQYQGSRASGRLSSSDADDLLGSWLRRTSADS